MALLSRSVKRRIKRILILGVVSYCARVVLSYFGLISSSSAPGKKKSRLSDADTKFPYVDVSDVTKERLFAGPENLCADGLHQDLPPHKIFFIEESSSQQDCLTARQACSVESASRANPDSPVAVVFMDGRNRTGNKCPITDQLIQKFPTIRLAKQAELMSYLGDTPLRSLLDSGFLNETSAIPRSDAVRLAIMWKQGAFYLDLDTIVLRPLHCLRNTLGLIGRSNELGNGAVTFELGHSFLWYLMNRMAEEPTFPALTEAVRDFCETPVLSAGTLSCWNEVTLELQPSRAFYPLKDPQMLYKDKADLAFYRKALRHSFLVQVGQSAGSVPAESFYGLLARDHCPLTYQLALDQGGF